MPLVAVSRATVLVRPATPCLAETYAALNGDATSECADAIEMMRPHLRFLMPATAARMAWKAADRLIAIIWFHFSIGNSSTGDTNWMPALLTRTSTEPRRFSAIDTISATSSGLVMSAGE